MITILAILITYAGLLQARPEHFSFESQVGLVEASAEGSLCLTASNPNLSNGTPVTFIFAYKPQDAARAVIEKKVGSCSPGLDPNPNVSFYLLKLAANERALDPGEPRVPAIAVIRSAKPVLVKHGIASADLDSDGQKEFFRICTSNEGLHLTVWSGKPLQGKRRWHSYYYLGYDVVPTCRKKDYE